MRNISKSKKGVVEVQFGWIFVLIVGALILIFFVTLVKSSTKSQSESKYIDLKDNLVGMMSQSEVDVGTTRTIGMPAITLSFNCSGFDIIGSSSSAEKLPYKTFFSPSTIKGRDMITYSEYWEMPYKVDYFVYVTSRQIRYNFVNDSLCYQNPQCIQLLSSILKKIPANLSYQVVSKISDVKENNYYKERFIIIDSLGSSFSLTVDESLSGLKNEDVTAINISGSSSYGLIQYYKKDSSGKLIKTLNSSYLGMPMLLGAIISEDSLYECNVEKSLQKFGIISTIYLNRTGYLNQYFYSSNPASPEFKCHTYYNSLVSMNGALEKTVEDLSQHNIFDYMEDLEKNSGIIENSNNDLMIGSCPMIY